jgi:hypothetical protein
MLVEDLHVSDEVMTIMSSISLSTRQLGAERSLQVHVGYYSGVIEAAAAVGMCIGLFIFSRHWSLHLLAT